MHTDKPTDKPTLNFIDIDIYIIIGMTLMIFRFKQLRHYTLNNKNSHSVSSIKDNTQKSLIIIFSFCTIATIKEHCLDINESI